MSCVNERFVSVLNLTKPRPSSNVGIDYAGPFEIKDRKCEQKDNQVLRFYIYMPCNKGCTFGGSQ